MFATEVVDKASNVSKTDCTPPINSGIEVTEGVTKVVKKHVPIRDGYVGYETTVTNYLPYGRSTGVSLAIGNVYH